jgi:cytidylate kinase
MYRVVALFALRRGIPLDHEEQISQLAAGIDLHLGQTVVADDEDVTMAIRSPEVNTAVSVIAALPKVRRVLVEQQRRLAAESESGSIVEGRDITTVVFPEAIVKIFLTAELGSELDVVETKASNLLNGETRLTQSDSFLLLRFPQMRTS